jgi:hypothetical protein
MRHLSVRRQLGLAAMGAVLLALVVPAATGSSPAFAQGSSVDISPDQGPPGTQVTATGTNWTAGDQIQAIWNGPTGTDVGSPVAVNSSGDFTLTFTVPSGATAGSYQVAFYDASQRFFEVANEDFTVTQSSTQSPPAAPFNVKIVPYGPEDFYITWTSNSTSQTGFQIYNGVTSETVGGTQDYYLWAAQPNQYMCIAVRAYNSSGDSAWAGMWTCATTGAGAAPAAPTNVVATPYSTSAIEISFVNQANNETAFLFYNGVTYGTVTFGAPPKGGPPPVKGSSYSVLWTGLKPGTYMCFKVAAYDQWGDSSYVPATWACASSKS